MSLNAEVAYLNANHAEFTDRAQHWSWAKYAPGETVPETSWPPGKTGADMMMEYWLTLWHGSRRYQGENWIEPVGLEARVQRSLDLSEANPYAVFDYPVTHWVTVQIAGKDERIKVTDIASWTRFAANAYNVVLDYSRVGRCFDSAFQQKVA